MFKIKYNRNFCDKVALFLLKALGYCFLKTGTKIGIKNGRIAYFIPDRTKFSLICNYLLNTMYITELKCFNILRIKLSIYCAYKSQH